AEVFKACVDLRCDAFRTGRVERRHFAGSKLLERGLQVGADLLEARALVSKGRDLRSQPFERHEGITDLREAAREAFEVPSERADARVDRIARLASASLQLRFDRRCDLERSR